MKQEELEMHIEFFDLSYSGARRGQPQEH